MAKRELPVLPEGFADNALPTGTFSHSQYGLYKKCPKAYEFRYVKKEVVPPKAAMTQGVLVHAGVEHALRSKMANATASLDEVESVITTEFNASKDGVDWEDTAPDSVRVSAINAYRLYHQRALPTVHPQAVESLILYKAGTVPVLGYLDLIDQIPGDPVKVVVDLKTSKAKWSDRDIDTDTQLTLYALATGIPHVRVDNLVIRSSTSEFQQLERMRSVQQMRVLTEDLEETVALIKAGIFPKTSIDSWMCTPNWCGYWTQCRGRKY